MNGNAVLWLALTFGICKVTCVMVEHSGVVMFGVPIFTHPFACYFLNIPHFRKQTNMLLLFVRVELPQFY